MEETISLKEIFEVIKDRFLLIVLFVLGTALLAAIISYFLLIPKYESTSQFIVNQSKEEMTQYSVNDIRSNVELINTYEVIIKSRAILDDVVAQLDLDYSSAVLENKIRVSSAQNPQVVNVTVTDEDPTMAVNIANATVKIFQQKVPELMNVDNVQILTEAVISPNPTPVSPKPKLNIAIGIVLGGMLGVGLAFLLEYLNTQIETEQDVEKHLALPVLGAISSLDEKDIVAPSRQSRGRDRRIGGTNYVTSAKK